MNEDVKREEFNNLKDRVSRLEEEMTDSKEMLVKIDKKIDLIGERLESADKINELKNQNIEGVIDNRISPLKVETKSNKDEINKIRENQTKLVFMILAELIGIVFSFFK